MKKKEKINLGSVKISHNNMAHLFLFYMSFALPWHCGQLLIFEKHESVTVVNSTCSYKQTTPNSVW